MENPQEPIEQDRPSFPQAPDKHVVDPLRLKYNGELLFSPCDHLTDGARHLYNQTQDPLSKQILIQAGVHGQNSAVKMLPNLSVIMKLCHDLSGQCELTPKDDKDPLLDPMIEFTPFAVEEYEPNAVFGGVSIGRLVVLEVSSWLVHFSAPIMSWQQFGTMHRQTTEGIRPNEVSSNPPMAVKLVMEVSQVPGVMGFSIMAPYAAVMFIPKLYAGRIEAVQREAEIAILRVIRQCTETRLREEVAGK